MKITDDYIFFWKESPMCNFTKCKIKYMFPDSEVGEELYFSSSEQLFMWFKAMFFNDTETAKLIYESNSPEEARKLGRLVKDYDDQLWDEVRVSYMRKAIIYKFFQNKELREQLLDKKYDGKKFVEAAYYDRIWGIGYNENDAIKNVANWGKNELGKILDEVREKSSTLEALISDLELEEV